jgi:cytosine/adenosine deaminase-related metal-dependent hydrolase
VTALRVRARWVLPVAGEPVADGAVLIGAEGRIAAVGPDGDVASPAGTPRVDLGDAALLPGLVNAHAHLELTALRGLVRDLPFFDWIQTVRALKDGCDADAYRAAARWGVLEGFAAGITTTGDTGSSRQAAAALAELGGRGVAYHEVFGPDRAVCAQTVAGAVRALADLEPCRSERVAVGLSPHAPYTVSEELLRAVTALAAERGLRTAMHVAESREERELVEEGRGPFAEHLRSRGIPVAPRASSTMAWLERTGFLAGRPLLVHCVTVSREDFGRAARAAAAVAHCPWSNAVLGHGRADLRAMRDAGLAVGLGTDSVAAGGRLDLFAEARLAAAGRGLPAREMLRLITTDAAAALRLADLGALAPGWWGDLAAVALAGPALAGGGSIEELVAWGATAADVIFAAVAGRVVYEAGCWPGVRLEEERAAFARAAAAASARSHALAGRGILAR